MAKKSDFKTKSRRTRSSAGGGSMEAANLPGRSGRRGPPVDGDVGGRQKSGGLPATGKMDMGFRGRPGPSTVGPIPSPAQKPK